jgi:hypothetical protein
MGGLKFAGALWIVAGLNSVGMAFGVWDEPILLTLALGGAIVGLTIGALLIARPGPDIVRWSNVAGLTWLVAFGALTAVEQATQMGYTLSVAIHTALGVGAALVTYSRGATLRRPESPSSDV